ncbi:MAG: hypothetical protein ACHQWU_09070 [Gemmatimonadales bacterium]
MSSDGKYMVETGIGEQIHFGEEDPHAIREGRIATAGPIEGPPNAAAALESFEQLVAAGKGAYATTFAERFGDLIARGRAERDAGAQVAAQDAERAALMAALAPAELAAFDEWRAHHQAGRSVRGTFAYLAHRKSIERGLDVLTRARGGR